MFGLIFGVIECWSACARIRPSPHQQTHPLQVSIETKVSECAITLFLELRCSVWIFLLTLSPWINGSSNFCTKRDSKRRVFDEVGTMIQKVTNDVWLPDLKHFDEWDRVGFGTISYQKFN
jgi:hypothetical protein